MYLDPPALFGSRSTAMVHCDRSVGSLQREYCRMRSFLMIRSMWAPNVHSGTCSPSRARTMERTSSASHVIWRTMYSLAPGNSPTSAITTSRVDSRSRLPPRAHSRVQRTDETPTPLACGQRPLLRQRDRGLGGFREQIKFSLD